MHCNTSSSKLEVLLVEAAHRGVQLPEGTSVLAGRL